jgi:heme/copper-type cytochrome/quinol oxidase subunit 4
MTTLVALSAYVVTNPVIFPFALIQYTFLFYCFLFLLVTPISF